MSRQRDEQGAPRRRVEPASIDLRLEGHASRASIVEGMNGVTTSVDGSALVVHITAPMLRDVQTVLDAVLAALNEAETTG